MSEYSRPSVPKWPFFVGDAVMLGLAWFVFYTGRNDAFTVGAVCACVALGAWLGVLPFILEYRIALKLAGSESLSDAMNQLKKLEAIANQISHATGQWQTVNDHSTKSVAAAKEIGERMTEEAKQFAEFMQKSGDSEKSTLRLEADKLRRAEGDWVQVVVRMLDHTYALQMAAARSGKTALIEQLTQFQNAQRDVVRRVGLTPFTAVAGEVFDAAKHQTAETEKPDSASIVAETVATGFTFRGQLVRLPLVTLAQQAQAEPAPEQSVAAPVAPQEQTLL